MPAVVDLVERVAAVHDCHVVALRHPAARSPFTIGGATIHALGGGRRSGPLGRGLVIGRGIRTVLGIHRRAPVDLVHALWADEAGAVATLAARLVRRPAVVSMMGGELVRLPAIGYGTALGVGGRWTTSIALRLADVLTAGSQAGRVALAERRGRVVPMPLGVDMTRFTPSVSPGLPSSDRDSRILFVGSLEPVKDPVTLLNAFALVAAGRPQVRLDVVGVGRLRPDLDRLVAQLGLGERVRFMGHVPRSALPAVYRTASLLAITSRHEAQSMVAVEAAASGLPVVGTNVGILPDLGKGARTVPVGDVTGLATALAEIVDDGVLAAAMGAAARAEAAENFDLERTSAATLDLYARLMQRR
jgi:glycosyltransferase involved in cell wall biosynthesis